MEDTIAAKRTSMLNRLEMAKLSEHLGKEPWVCAANSAYEACVSPSVSVLITLYNYSEYIYRCLDSVCDSKDAALPGGFEIIVVEDCSTDGSARLVEQYLDQSPFPIRLVKKLFNTGLADARNVGLKLARAPYVFILDADNWIYPNCLSKLYQAIEHSAYAATYGIISEFDNCTQKGVGLSSKYGWDIPSLVNAPYLDAMAMFDKQRVLQVGGYSTELVQYGWFGWEDYDLWLKLAQEGYSCKLVPQILSSYRVHSHSMLNTTNRYVGEIATYFTRKFSRLIQQHRELDILFGFPVSFFSTSTGSSPSTAPDNAQRLEKVKLRLRRTQEQLEQVEGRIKAMETSKFWKMRKAWFRVKRLMGSSELE